MVESTDYTMDSNAALYLSGVLHRRVNTLSQHQKVGCYLPMVEYLPTIHLQTVILIS